MNGEQAMTKEWETEPNRKHWVDEATGLDCLIVRNATLTLCGYVGVPFGHPWYGLDYDAIDAEVHGGLTFSDICHDHICHDPATELVANADVWWLGFDTGHVFDLIPGLEEHLKPMRDVISDYIPAHFPRETYKNMAYVEAECAKLAAQAAEARR